jgi:hypothetical protein
MSDLVLFSLCMYSVGVTMLYLTALKKRMKLEMLLVGATLLVKKVAEGKASVIRTAEGVEVKHHEDEEETK